MARQAFPRSSAPWITLVIHAGAMAALVFLLKYAEYRFWIRELRIEVYVGIVAVLFTALGVWIGRKLLEGRKKDPPADPSPAPSPEAARALGISGRELEVLQLMALGHSNQEIADRLFISLPTVKSHTSNLFVKLDVSRRTQAVHKAKAAGILP